MDHVQEINAKLLKENIDNYPIIDIRTPEEWYASGVVPNSHLLTFFHSDGRYSLIDWMSEFEKIVTDKNQKFVLVCAHANRTRDVGDYLARKLGYENTFHLSGGIVTWFQAGFDVTIIED